MKLRHDFAGHYNRPDIFQLHLNRSVPHLYTADTNGEGAVSRIAPEKAHPGEGVREENPSMQIQQPVSVQPGDIKN
jgi:hypothetical protein